MRDTWLLQSCPWYIPDTLAIQPWYMIHPRYIGIVLHRDFTGIFHWCALLAPHTQQPIVSGLEHENLPFWCSIWFGTISRPKDWHKVIDCHHPYLSSPLIAIALESPFPPVQHAAASHWTWDNVCGTCSHHWKFPQQRWHGHHINPWQFFIQLMKSADFIFELPITWGRPFYLSGWLWNTTQNHIKHKPWLGVGSSL